MRTLTIEKTVYNLNDVKNNKDLLDKVLEKYRDINVEHNEWYDNVYYDFKSNEGEAANKGFEVDRIYFSGFWSQGDGAMFEGKLVDINKIIDNSGINKRVIDLIKKGHINIYASFKHYGHYYHEKSYTNSFDYDFNLDYISNLSNISSELDSLETYICDIYEDMCRDLYGTLEKEYYYLTSDEVILETLECNEYEFDENGKITW